MKNAQEASVHEEGLASLRLTRTPEAVRLFFGAWTGALAFSALFILVVPWTQSVIGTGQVTVLSPMERPQNVNAEIDGRLSQWKVREGQFVQAGTVLAILAESRPEYLDPEMLTRIRGQRAAAALKRDAARAQLKGYDSLVSALKQLGRAHLPSAQLQAMSPGAGLDDSGRRLLAAEQQMVVAARVNLERIESLHTQGLRSTRDLELARRELAKAEGDVESKLLDAELKRSSVLEKLGGLESELLKAETDLARMERRGEQREVRSPVSGVVVSLYGVGAGHVLKAGDVMAVVAPETTDQAVELMLSDHDAPLVSVGRPVRLQFSGWPALQLSGWPSVAAGTFAGRIAVIDAVGDGKGRVRALVRPDPDAVQSGHDEPWPAPSTLRAGSQVVGWILLDRVPLWFELWRRFNGFPPSLNSSPSGKEARK